MLAPLIGVGFVLALSWAMFVLEVDRAYELACEIEEARKKEWLRLLR